jgi:hypothetical protein
VSVKRLQARMQQLGNHKFDYAAHSIELGRFLHIEILELCDKGIKSRKHVGLLMSRQKPKPHVMHIGHGKKKKDRKIETSKHVRIHQRAKGYVPWGQESRG